MFCFASLTLYGMFVFVCVLHFGILCVLFCVLCVLFGCVIFMLRLYCGLAVLRGCLLLCSFVLCGFDVCLMFCV